MSHVLRGLIAASTVVCVMALSTVQGGGFLLRKSDIPKTIAILKTGTAKEKAYAARLLGDRGAVRASDVKDAVAPLRFLVQNNKDAKVRAAAARALGQIASEPDETAKLLLMTLKNDKSDEVKMASMVAIGSLGPKVGRMAVSEMRKIARDKDNKRLSRKARMVLKEMKKQKQ
ncbi:MAG: HEAT repeat domain-containing protein [Gemmataceae bacterium]